jgi:AcrR family transcriptional regulator
VRLVKTLAMGERTREDAPMARRGDELREHVLVAARGVFLEMGFERASMDEVASRAQTTKRSLYAHFESKEKLFLAVIERARGRFLERLKVPEAYSSRPAEALVHFCGRYLEVILYEPSVQLIRVTMAETTRFSEAAAQHYDVMFVEASTRLAAYLKATFGLSVRVSADATQRLLGQILFPLLPRVLFGLEQCIAKFDPRALSPQVDLRPVRKAVAELIESLAKTRQ